MEKCDEFYCVGDVEENIYIKGVCRFWRNISKLRRKK